MANDLLTQILGGVLGGQRGGGNFPAGGAQGGLGDLLGGVLGGNAGGGRGPAGLDDMLGGILGGGGGGGGVRRGNASPLGGGQGALLAMLLPLAMQWVQRNGGVGALLERFKQAGQGHQAQSWVGTGDNEEVSPQAVREVVGMDELSRLSQQLGVPDDQVAGGLAEIFPEMVNQLTPAGDLPPDADDRMSSGLGTLEQWLGGMARR
jgi:uncharacterized protein YidB (DUF937 family)